MASSGSFAKLATVTASTKRPPAISSGKRGAPAENVASLVCTPLDPCDPGMRAELQQRLALNTPHELLQTFVDSGVDIVEGDLLVVDSVEYPVRSAGQWTWGPTSSSYVRLVLEDLKN